MAQLYPVTGIATLLKLSSRRIHQLVKDGILPRPVGGQYDPIGCVHGYIDYLRKIAAGSGELSLTDERTRLTKYQADLAQIELGTSRGEIISQKDAERLWTGVITITRQKLLGTGVRLAPVLRGKTSIAEIKETIDEHIREILSELEHSQLEEPTGPAALPEADGVLPPPAEIDGERMGRPKQKAEPGKQRRTGKMANRAG